MARGELRPATEGPEVMRSNDDPHDMTKHVAFVLLLLTGTPGTIQAQEPAYDPDASAEEILDALIGAEARKPIPSPWRGEAQIRLGGGHAWNVLYSPFAERDSPFSSVEADLLAFRRADSPHALDLYGYGSHRHYFDLDEDNTEATAIVQAGWEYRGMRRSTPGVRAHYYYVDQFLDTSISDVETDTTRLTEQDVGLESYVAYAINPAVTARLGGAFKYACLEDSDDDYRQPEASASLTGRTPFGLSLAAHYRYHVDDYDSRSKRSAAGEPLPGDPVEIRNHNLRIESSWFWDARHRWQTRCWVAQRCREDDGGGYYDYESSQAGLGLRGQLGRWSADVRVSYADTDYDERPSDAGNPASPPVSRQRWVAGCRAERQWHRRWNVFTEANWEDNDSNDRFEVYNHASAVVGIGYVFTSRR